MLRPGTLLGSLTPILLMAGGVTAGGAIAEHPAAADTSISPVPRSAPLTLALKPVATPDLPTTCKSIQRLSGFSADGRHYIHLESSRDTGAGIPKSTLQVVEMSADRAPDRPWETRYGEAQAGLSLAQAELALLQQTWTLRQSLQLATPQTGKTLKILSRSRDAQGTEILTFRRDSDAAPWELRLHQKQLSASLPADPTTQDQAALELELIHAGQRRVVGNLAQSQASVLDYSVREIKLSPQGDRVAILVTATQPTFEGALATTLVRGFEL